MNRHEDRIVWLDILKGIGIFSVIVGHIPELPWGNKFFYFHMPLFFIISGYTFSSNKSFFLYLGKITIRLMVPYFLFLPFVNFLLLDEPYSLNDLFIGGEGLYGELGAVWFVTVLFLSLILFRVFSRNVIVVAMSGFLTLVTSYYFIPEHPYSYIWNARVVPFAYAFLCMGNILKTIEWPRCFSGEYQLPIVLVLFTGIFFIPNLSMDIKHAIFGVPWISYLTSVIQVCCLAIICLYLEKHFKYTKIFAYLGRHSYALMLIHMPVICYFRNITNDSIKSFGLLAIVLLVSLVVLSLFNYFKSFVVYKYECYRKNQIVSSTQAFCQK